MSAVMFTHTKYLIQNQDRNSILQYNAKYDSFVNNNFYRH